MKQLEELKQKLEDRYSYLESQAKNRRSERLGQIKMTIYAITQYISLQVRGLLSPVDIDKLVQHIKTRFHV